MGVIGMIDLQIAMKAKRITRVMVNTTSVIFQLFR